MATGSILIVFTSPKVIVVQGSENKQSLRKIPFFKNFSTTVKIKVHQQLLLEGIQNIIRYKIEQNISNIAKSYWFNMCWHEKQITSRRMFQDPSPSHYVSCLMGGKGNMQIHL